MSDISSYIVCISCSIFKSELSVLKKNGEIHFPIHYVSSMLHMDPAKLRTELESLLKREINNGKHVLLLYGGCHAYMRQQEAIPGVYRVKGMNCLDILLGHDRYRSLLSQGAFILLPEWTMRWKEIFQAELGLDMQLAKDFMQDMHTRLVYLDTGHEPIPLEHLQAFSEYSGLPFKVLPVDLDPFQASIREAIKNIKTRCP